MTIKMTIVNDTCPFILERFVVLNLVDLNLIFHGLLEIIERNTDWGIHKFSSDNFRKAMRGQVLTYQVQYDMLLQGENKNDHIFKQSRVNCFTALKYCGIFPKLTSAGSNWDARLCCWSSFKGFMKGGTSTIPFRCPAAVNCDKNAASRWANLTVLGSCKKYKKNKK